MRTWVGLAIAFLFLLSTVAVAQYQPQEGGGQPQPQYPPQVQQPPVQQPTAYPRPPAGAGQQGQQGTYQDPRMERQPAGQMPPNPIRQGPPGAGPQGPQFPPGFPLSPHEQAQVDRVLQFWEQNSGQVKSYHCKFFRMEYNAFGNPARPGDPQRVDKGEIWYSAPDKGNFTVDEPRPEKWVCDGKAVYEYDFNQRKVRKYEIPPEQQGKGITDGPLPFIFGAKAAQLSRRYWIRISTPPEAKEQVWLEVYPKFQGDAANFRRVDLILSTKTMLPFALQQHDPGGQSRTVFQFPPETIEVNKQNLRGIFQDPFAARVPGGWQMVSGDVPQTQGPAVRSPSLGSRPMQGNR